MRSGQLKFVMYNPQKIYLHDTNARSRFNGQVRAPEPWLHPDQGCARSGDELLGDDNGEWSPEKIQETLATRRRSQAKFVKPLPVYIVYFSAAALNDGTIVNYKDLYKRDAKVIAALLEPKARA